MCVEADDGQTLGSGFIDSTPVNSTLDGVVYHCKVNNIILFYLVGSGSEKRFHT